MADERNPVQRADTNLGKGTSMGTTHIHAMKSGAPYNSLGIPDALSM